MVQVEVLCNIAILQKAQKYSSDLSNCKDFINANIARRNQFDAYPFFKKGNFVFVEIYKKQNKKKGIETLIRACFLIKKQQVEWLKIEKGVRKI